MIDTGIKFPIPTRNRWTGHCREDVLDITKCITMLGEDEGRNALILERVVQDIKEGHVPLILSDRVAHNTYLHAELNKMGYNTILLTGATRKKVNWGEVRKDETVQAVVATSSIASERLDFPRLSSLHITTPTSNLPKLKQKVGRIRRVVEGKLMPVVRDYVDNNAYLIVEDEEGNKKKKFPLRYGSLNRVKFYKKAQKDYGED